MKRKLDWGSERARAEAVALIREQRALLMLSRNLTQERRAEVLRHEEDARRGSASDVKWLTEEHRALVKQNREMLGVIIPREVLLRFLDSCERDETSMLFFPLSEAVEMCPKDH